MNVFGDDLNQGLVPASEEEIEMCEEKTQKRRRSARRLRQDRQRFAGFQIFG